MNIEGRRILVVEDDPGFQAALTDLLKSRGYVVSVIGDGLDARNRILAEDFDLVLLDVLLPRMSGFDICMSIREQGLQTPILMLTARGQARDKVHGLGIGADDYLAKPFDSDELLARISVLLRRLGRDSRKEWIEFGDTRVNVNNGKVFRAKQRVDLSERELALLRYLIEHKGRVVSRDELLVHVWGYDASSTSRTVDMHVAQVRRKLERDPKDPKVILTVHAQGYRFVGRRSLPGGYSDSKVSS